MPRPRTYDDGVRRRLLEATSRVVSTDGPAAVAVRPVAAAAGTTTAAVYALFGGRDALLEAVVAEGFHRFADHLAAVERSGDPGRDLLALGIAYRRSAFDEPHFYRAMFGLAPGTAGGARTAAGGARTAAGDTHGEAGRDALAQPTFGVLRDAVARLLTAQGRDTAGAEDGAVRLWSLAHGLVSLELAGLLPGDADQHEARYVAALLASRP